MATRKLYGCVNSTSTLRALASLYEHEVEFEFFPVDLKNTEDQNTQTFLSLNPFGEEPAFQDRELILFESRAIMRCVSHAYAKPGKELVYIAPKLQGMATAWIDVEDHHFNPPASRLVTELVKKPKQGLTPDEAVVAEARSELAVVLDVYEQRLKETSSGFLGGDKLTSADLTHTPSLHYLMGTPSRELFETRPLLNSWCKELLARPAWAKVVDLVNKHT
ncbi:hypothetical protein Droror1_Dr00003850 [Drosera rotundifolia]